MARGLGRYDVRRDVAWAGVALALLVAMAWLGGSVSNLLAWELTHADSVVQTAGGGATAVAVAVIKYVAPRVAVRVALAIGAGFVGVIFGVA